MKGVPVRRVTIPRIPAPPEVARGRRATPCRAERPRSPGDAAGNGRDQRRRRGDAQRNGGTP